MFNARKRGNGLRRSLNEPKQRMATARRGALRAFMGAWRCSAPRRAFAADPDPARARELVQAAQAQPPNTVAAHLELGRAYYVLGQYAEAKIEFETVLRFDNLPPRAC